MKTPNNRMALGLGRLGRRQKERDPDTVTLNQLERRGAKLNRPRHVLHFLEFAEEADARAAVETLERAGWEVELTEPSVRHKRWRLRAEGVRVLDRSTAGAFRASFERLAEQLNGVYDGWEAAAKP